jgi:hypothetical protein
MVNSCDVLYFQRVSVERHQNDSEISTSQLLSAPIVLHMQEMAQKSAAIAAAL